MSRRGGRTSAGGGFFGALEAPDAGCGACCTPAKWSTTRAISAVGDSSGHRPAAGGSASGGALMPRRAPWPAKALLQRARVRRNSGARRHVRACNALAVRVWGAEVGAACGSAAVRRTTTTRVLHSPRVVSANLAVTRRWRRRAGGAGAPASPPPSAARPTRARSRRRRASRPARRAAAAAAACAPSAARPARCATSC